MSKKILLLSAGLLLSSLAGAQTRDPNNKYLVWTNNVIFSEEKTDTLKESVPEEEDEAKSFIEKYFRYVPMCDWQEGMKFMVIPDKTDMVVRTFADSTGRLVSSLSLRNKIMIYKGHSGEGDLHERVNFLCEDDGKSYYYELPTASFGDYCYTKFGVTTLAYLGDVDMAVDQLVGKTVITKYKEYNVDISTTSYGYEKIKVPLGTEATVVAAGVGTRNYPVKLIVADSTGREFFQNVAISRTNSGMRDNEFTGDELKHTFEGSFELLGDKANEDKKYNEYIGRKVFTLYKTQMLLANGVEEIVPRLTGFEIKAMNVISGTHSVKMTLEHEGKTYMKKVSFKQNSVIGDLAGYHEDYYFNLFASGNVGSIKGVRQENMTDIRNGIIRKGFNEAEVELALGKPDAKSKAGNNSYMWVYNSAMNSNNCVIYFDAKTRKVTLVKK